ncbi:hypothetical protein [Streptomyces sp. NPDC008125]|uniref:hypothetical protein n=1 Tax=Streptomyces sp. NPDC008125 TaxID=3364811 RepID=UPI0036E55976
MKRFVVVEAPAFGDVLHARCANASFTVRLSPGRRAHSPEVVDEHLVVDVDACRDASLLDCADVLQGSLTHSTPGALRRLAELMSAHPACGIAAVPVSVAGAGGARGWALAAGADRTVVLAPNGPHRPYRGSAGQSLLPSCVHAWLVEGRSLREWPSARAAPSD